MMSGDLHVLLHLGTRVSYAAPRKRCTELGHFSMRAEILLIITAVVEVVNTLNRAQVFEIVVARRLRASVQPQSRQGLPRSKVP